MENIVTESALQDEILLLKAKQSKEAELIKEEFHAITEKLKPTNIVNTMLHETAASPRIRETIIHKTVDVALVILTNSLLRKTTNSFVKRAIGTAVVLGIKNIVARNPQMVKKAGNGILNIVGNIITKRNRNKEYNNSRKSTL